MLAGSRKICTRCVEISSPSPPQMDHRQQKVRESCQGTKKERRSYSIFRDRFRSERDRTRGRSESIACEFTTRGHAFGWRIVKQLENLRRSGNIVKYKKVNSQIFQWSVNDETLDCFATFSLEGSPSARRCSSPTETRAQQNNSLQLSREQVSTNGCP